MLLENNGELVLSHYRFHERGRVMVSEYWNKRFLCWDSITQSRTEGELVRLEIVARSGQDIASAQAVLDSFTQKLMKTLPNYVPQ